MEEMIIIHSDDKEISRRLAQMLEETGYITCILNNLEELFELKTTKKPMLIIMECQPNCLRETPRIEFIRKLSAEVHPKLILISTVEQIPEMNELIGENCIKFLTKPVLYTNFIRQVDEILHSANHP